MVPQHLANDTQHNDTQHSATQYNDVQYDDAQHNETRDNIIKRETQHDTQNLVSLCLT
jgi:hypothetical protein